MLARRSSLGRTVPAYVGVRECDAGADFARTIGVANRSVMPREVKSLTLGHTDGQ